MKQPALLLLLLFTGCTVQHPITESPNEQEAADMQPFLVAQDAFSPGTPTTIEAPSPSVPLAVVFEDDGDTGYFYALELEDRDNPIVDALHIYCG
jgi:hypothetical protein